VLLVGLCAAAQALAGSLENEIGRNEIRIYAAPYRPPLGARVGDLGLAERLEGQGYRRVSRRPEIAGEFFWGFDAFWLFRRAGRLGEARLVGWRLARPDGRIIGFLEADSAGLPPREREAVELEPELLATSFDQRRAERRWVAFEELPEHVWRPLVAIEDARFFTHHGIDGRGVARALLANLQSGSVVQGGSTLTQQLIKLRDLTPKRSLGRKASEAVRALALEAEHSKEEILEAYLNLVYYGHVDGVSLYGIDAAARAYYATPPERLDLAQSAALAALVQGPNQMSPLRHPERLAERYDRVLARLEELEWASLDAIARARRQGLPTPHSSVPRTEGAAHFRQWLRDTLAPGEGADHGAGVQVETTLDARLQTLAEDAVAAGLGRLRRQDPSLSGQRLSAALVALDVTSGEVLAYVGGDPGHPDEFDRARQGRRQPGSTVKPFVALEAFESCGREPALFPSRRVRDRPLTLQLPSGDWSPQNADRRFRGTVTVRDTLTQSLNVPTVRIARHCGFEAVAQRLRRAGLSLPGAAPPAFVLGAVETSSLELAGAYALFANGGKIERPHGIRRAYRPNGRRILARTNGRRKVASAAAAYMVYDLLRRPEIGPAAYGKTGTSSRQRDAWYAGGSGRLLAVVWVGLDDDQPLGFGGSGAAEPIWRDFVTAAAPTLTPYAPQRPAALVEHWIDPATGLRLKRSREGAEHYWFKRRARPPLKRLWRRRSPLDPID
jgi:membrane peptidoglycan carboxypeptidase